MVSLSQLLAGHGDLPEYDQAPPDYIEQAPVEVRNRIKALKKVQRETIDLQADFYKRVHDLEIEFRSKFEAINDKRKDIVTGKREPAEGETDEKIFHYLSDEANQSFDNSAPVSGTPVTGIPGFWLHTLQNGPNVCEIITDDDEDILKYLIDLRAFTLTFEFAENPYFKNKVLTKKYNLSIGPNGFEDIFLYDGPSVVATQGCTIDWNEGKSTTQKVVKKKQKKGPNAGRYVTKTVETESFFQFFSPKITEIKVNMNEEEAELLNADFEIGQILRESIIDSAVLYFTGELADDDDAYGFEDQSDGEEEGDGDDE